MKHPTVFHLIADVFDQAKVPFVLVGGFAVNYYKATRATADVDILTTEENFQKTLPLFQEVGYDQTVKQHLFARLRNNLAKFIDIDILFVDERTFDGVIHEAKEILVEGAKLRVPSLNHLIALKLHSIKHNPEREFRDLWDILELIKRNQLNIQSENFRELCLNYGTEELYHKISESQK